MQVPHFDAPVIFLAENVRPQGRAGTEVHGIGISRNVVKAEQHSSAQLKIWRELSLPLEIPLQAQRVESRRIGRICGLKNQVNRHRVHCVFESPPQKSRPMRSRDHPSIAQSCIKGLSILGSSGNRVSAASPNLYFVAA